MQSAECEIRCVQSAECEIRCAQVFPKEDLDCADLSMSALLIDGPGRKNTGEACLQ